MAEAKDAEASRQAAGAEADKKADARADSSALAEATTRDADRRDDLSRRSAEARRRKARRRSAEKAEAAGRGRSVRRPRRARRRWRRRSRSALPRRSSCLPIPRAGGGFFRADRCSGSADGGATWQTQTTGVSETLSGGSSPSPSVCWLVGPRGIVLRTTDGRSWTRIPFPEAVQLASIRATDDKTATVTTEDGREFVTEDGGRTWSERVSVLAVQGSAFCSP